MKVLPLFVALLFIAASARPARSAPDDVDTRLRRLTPIQMDEVLWLARCVYSESDRPHEQRLVAWVVRNRVETRYRGYTYREVVLETKQFSAFNDPTPRRTHLLELDFDTKLPAWRSALGIALDVFLAPPTERPFPVTTRHFYSPVSMVGRSQPTWADGVEPLSSAALGVDPDRFQFFTDIDPELAGTPAAIATTPMPAPAGGGRTLRTGGRSRLSPPALRGTVQRPARPSVERPNRH